jgi:hypothetical protein
MRKVIRSIFAAIVASAVPAVVFSEPLKCSVNVRDETHFESFVPQTEFGKSFSEFTLDLLLNPDEAWEHQNICVSRHDFKGARFTGSLCLIVMSTRLPATPKGSPALYISVWHGKPISAPLPQHRSKSPLAKRRMTSDSELVIPINSDAREVRWQQFFRINSARDLAYFEIDCKAK